MPNKFTSDELKQAVVEWQESHEVVSLVRRLVIKLAASKKPKPQSTQLLRRMLSWWNWARTTS